MAKRDRKKNALIKAEIIRKTITNRARAEVFIKRNMRLKGYTREIAINDLMRYGVDFSKLS